MNTRTFSTAIALLAIFCAQVANADIVAFTPVNNVANGVNASSGGYEFAVNAAIRVRSLGVFDNQRNGPGVGGTSTVSISETINGAVVGSAIVSGSVPNASQPITSTLLNDTNQSAFTNLYNGAFRYGSSAIGSTAALLLAGKTYQISATTPSSNVFATGFGAAQAGANPALTYMGVPSGVFGPNFTFDLDEKPGAEAEASVASISDADLATSAGVALLSWTSSDDFDLQSTNAVISLGGNSVASSSASASFIDLQSVLASGIGDFQLDVTATDAAQQTFTASDSINVYDDDADGPLVGITGPNNQPGESTIEFSASDTFSGLASVQVSIVHNGIEIYSESFGSSFDTFSYDVASFGQGLFTASITAVDADNDRVGDASTNSLTLGFVSAVPEPSTYAALAGLGLAFGWSRRRRAARSQA